jgi:hypothetical protein
MPPRLVLMTAYLALGQWRESFDTAQTTAGWSLAEPIYQRLLTYSEDEQ